MPAQPSSPTTVPSTPRASTTRPWRSGSPPWCWRPPRPCWRAGAAWPPSSSGASGPAHAATGKSSWPGRAQRAKGHHERCSSCWRGQLRCCPSAAIQRGEAAPCSCPGVGVGRGGCGAGGGLCLSPPSPSTPPGTNPAGSRHELPRGTRQPSPSGCREPGCSPLAPQLEALPGTEEAPSVADTQRQGQAEVLGPGASRVRVLMAPLQSSRPRRGR